MQTNRTCPVCGIAYYAETNRLKHGRQTTCSRSCSYVLRGSKLKNKITINCATCGKQIKRPPSQIKSKHGSYFCSRACHYKGRSIGAVKRIVKKPYNVTEEGRAAWRKGAKKARETRIKRNNYGHTQQTITKIRHATSRAIAEGRIPARSKIEKEVRAFLESMGVEFFYQHPVRDNRGCYLAVFDFFIPKHNTVIEVNGTFWHADKRFFPDGPIHASQHRTAAAWKRKMVLIEERGYDLLIAWEDDIKKRGAQYLSEVLLPITA